MDMSENKANGTSRRDTAAEAEKWLSPEEKALRDDTAAADQFRWKRLLPFNPWPTPGFQADRRYPAMEAGWLSITTYHWMNRAIWTAFRGRLGLDDLWRLHPRNHVDNAGEAVAREWQSELEKHNGDASKVSMARCLFRPVRWRIALQFTLMLIYAALSFAGQSIFVFELISFAQRPVEETETSDGLLLAMGVFLNEVARTTIFAMHWNIGIDIGERVRAAVNVLVYRKITRLRSLGAMTMGQLVNLCVNDAERLYQVTSCSSFAIQGPLMMISVLAYAIVLVGWPALLGFSSFILFYFLQAMISHYQTVFRRKAIKVTDTRVRTMNEILTFVKLIKMYAWEKPFAKFIDTVREKEKIQLRRSAYMQGVSTSLTLAFPALATVITLATRALTGGSLTTAEAFALLATFGSMRHPLGTMPYFMRQFSESRVALPRIKQVLLLPEMQPVSAVMQESNSSVEVAQATLFWESTEDSSPGNPASSSASKRRDSQRRLLSTSSQRDQNGPTETQPPNSLTDISLTLKRGELIGVCGAFGSGKSSLLSAILGGMNLRSGRVAISGSVAYVSQQAWIFNASLRDNVLFGSEYDVRRYQHAITAAALLPDLKLLPDGDKTEIGERGINLSGGQKQRVSLARALYAARDIYLLDDPLSAVDAHVGAHIFNELIKKELQGKTVVLVTHQLQYLPQCDRVVMMASGRIAEAGTYNALMAGGTEFRTLMETFALDQATAKTDAGQGTGDEGMMHVSTGEAADVFSSLHSLAGSDDKDGGDEGYDRAPAALVKAEDRQGGSISRTTYSAFMRACGGAPVVIALLLLSMLSAGAQAGTDYWLGYWLRQGDGNTTASVSSNVSNASNTSAPATTSTPRGNIADHPDLDFFVGIYFALAITLFVLSIFRSTYAMYILLQGCSRLHNMVFRKVMKAPMSFFESTPIGQIVNRFSKDMDEIDSMMPVALGIVVRNSMNMVLVVLFASAIYPVLFGLLPILLFFFWLLYRFYSGFVRDIKRLDGVTRSPFISTLTATVQGLSTLHAYGKEEQYRRRFSSQINQNMVCHQAFYLSTRWLALRLDLLSAIMVGCTALLLILFRGSIDITLGAIALAYVVQLGALLQFTVRMFSEMNARFTSVERLNYYATSLDEEAPDTPENITAALSLDSVPPHMQGCVTFDRVCMRYRKGTPQVLHDLSFHVGSCEKIGVIGRTGAGKSSLAVCLLRLVELDSGRILIDGVDIGTLGLRDLRSRLSIIPQDPVLFIGSIRYNLDPFNKHTDEDVRKALEQTHLMDTIDRLPEGLQTQVIENGENFSVGERQLMCMARALLRHSKILILDEATASIDSETDALIQKTIRECFANSTLLTIAHRLNTVLDSDRLLVLDEGQVAEFDTPAKLIADSSSLVSQMLNSPGGGGNKKRT